MGVGSGGVLAGERREKKKKTWRKVYGVGGEGTAVSEGAAARTARSKRSGAERHENSGAGQDRWKKMHSGLPYRRKRIWPPPRRISGLVHSWDDVRSARKGRPPHGFNRTPRPPTGLTPPSP